MKSEAHCSLKSLAYVCHELMNAVSTLKRSRKTVLASPSYSMQ